jgi:DNA-binding transcriptional LysR family regulator
MQEVYNESAAPQSGRGRDGITVIPESARHRCPATVKLVSIPDLDLTVALDLVWRADARMSPLIARLVEGHRKVNSDWVRQGH